MRLIHRALNHVRYAASSKLLVGALFVALTGVALGGVTLTNSNVASAQTCKTNNILPCGTNSAADFVNQYKTNKTGDLHAIYAAFGLDASEIDRFARTAKLGMAYRDGTVKLDGKVVATNGNSLGRDKKSYSKTVSIGNNTYYADRDQDAFLSDIPAYIMMNGDQFEFAVLTACGNPVKGTPTGQPPKYSCDMLKPQQINRTTFSYTTDTTALHGATVAKLVYDFGDGKSQTVTSGSQVVSHTYAKEGTYTTKVTAYVSVNGETKTATGPQCAKPVTVKPAPPTPAYACDMLVATTISQENRQYRFTAQTTQSGGAVLTSADFTFGDNNSVKSVKPAGDSTVSAEHTYAAAGNYTITATVNFTVAGKVTSVTCQVKISPTQQPPAECKPGIPVGDSRCTEVPTTPETPTALPSTGPTEIIGGALGTTSIVATGSYFLRSRRSLLNHIWRR